MNVPILSVRNFAIGFAGSASILRSISFDIAPGECLGLAGDSGSGKTLLAWACLGMLPADATTEGEMSLLAQGQKVNLLSGREASRVRGRTVAIIPQNPFTSLNPAFRCGPQVEECIDRRVAPVADRKRKVLRQFEAFGLEDAERIYRAYPHQLSGGQLQRVVTAMATVNDPALLIADEPTTALDTVIQKDVLSKLKEWHRSLPGAAMLLISHDIDVIAFLCTRMIRLREGRIAYNGPVDDLNALSTDNVHNKSVTRDGAHASAVVDEPGDGVKSALSVNQLTKSYPAGRRSGATIALDDVNLSVRRGEIAGLVGRSGSGKSTLAKVVGGLVRGDAGDISFGAHAAADLGRSQRSSLVQIIFQDPYSSLYPHTTVGYILREALSLHRPELHGSALEQRIGDLLSEVGLPAPMAQRSTTNLSGGERQRVQIARALAAEPDVLICDECVAGLDNTVRQRIIALLTELNARRGLTILFISHDLEVVRQFCQRIFVIHDGRIAEEGATEEVFRQPRENATKALLEARLRLRN